MIPALRLGLRLASGTPGQRGRSVLTALAAAAGTLVLLVVMAMVAAPQVRDWFGYGSELVRFQAAVVGGVALPVLALAATVGRLSASIRDRRLANLRLLGLTAAQTRMVAAVEAGVAALAGTALGLAAFGLLGLVPGTWSLAGVEWRLGELEPTAASYAVALVGVPLAVVTVSSLPQRLDTRRALERARQADTRRPSWWRVLPMTVGVGASLWSWRANADHQLSNSEIVLMFAAVGLTGIGLLLVVPVFVRLLADLVLWLSRTPTTTIAARRLQAQPAGVTRVISALMIGLFLVVGARAVVGSFESTSQYVLAEQAETVRQVSTLLSPADVAASEAATAGELAGVRDVVTLPRLALARGERARVGASGWSALVGTCADLRRMSPEWQGCVDGEPLWLRPPSGRWVDGEFRPLERATVGISLTESNRRSRQVLVLGELTRMATAEDPDTAGGYVGGDLLLPPGTPGLERLVGRTDRQLVVVGDPGRGLSDRLQAAGLTPQMWADTGDYDFVAGLRAIVYTLAAVILSLGLLTFGIAAIDRALGRRRELASLQVIGTPPGVLRRAQWIEAALPTTLGTLLAIAAGAFAGSTYLRLDGAWSRHLGRIVPPMLTLSVLAVVASIGVAALTVAATNSKLTSDLIRTE